MVISNKVENKNYTVYASFLFLKLRRILPSLLGFLLVNIANAQTSTLFESDEMLEITLKCELKSVLRDRGENPVYHKAILQYQDNQAAWDIPIQIRVRGHFRKIPSNCKFPPLYLNFEKSSTPEASMFHGQDKIKLVTPCRNDQYVIHEYLVYKLYNFVTSKSFKARLVTVIFHDNTNNKRSGPYCGILLEEEDQMAKRNNSYVIEIEGLKPEGTRKDDFIQMAVFQYMIGNTDWSVQYLQNVKLIMDDSTKLPVTVPYDFDHAGIVRAPYANPAPELKMSSTLERRYRGYCLSEMDQFNKVFEKFNELEDDFFMIYEDNPLLNDRYIEQTLKFLDQFYETINDPKKVQKEFRYPCDESGTGNIVIKGLKKD